MVIAPSVPKPEREIKNPGERRQEAQEKQVASLFKTITYAIDPIAIPRQRFRLLGQGTRGNYLK